MKMRSLKYDESAVKNLAAEIAEIISQAKLSSVELAFALAAVLRGLGEMRHGVFGLLGRGIDHGPQVTPRYPVDHERDLPHGLVNRRAH